MPEKSRGMHRVRACINVRLGGSPGITGRCLDLSMSGMFVETDAHYELGTVIPIAMLDPTPGGRALVRVARVTPRGMGLEFAQVPGTTLRKILNHVSPERSKPLRRRTLDLCRVVLQPRAYYSLA